MISDMRIYAVLSRSGTYCIVPVVKPACMKSDRTQKSLSAVVPLTEYTYEHSAVICG